MSMLTYVMMSILLLFESTIWHANGYAWYVCLIQA